MPTKEPPLWRRLLSLKTLILVVLVATLVTGLGYPKFEEKKEGLEELRQRNEQLEERNKELEKIFEQLERQKDQLRRYLEKKGSPLGARYILSAILFEEKMPGFTKLSVAIAGAESTWGKSYRNPYNVIGAGHCAGCKGKTFTSWDHAHSWLYGHLRKQGFTSITIDDIPKIKYASSPHWKNSVRRIWLELGGI